MYVVVEGRQGRREQRDQGDKKSVQTHHQVRVMGLTTKIRCSCFNVILLDEKVRGINDANMLQN